MPREDLPDTLASLLVKAPVGNVTWGVLFKLVGVHLQVRQMLRTKQHMRVLMAYGISAAGKTFTVEVMSLAVRSPALLQRPWRASFPWIANAT